MSGKNRSGFEEVPHTADWALRVWSDDFPGLLEYAARGMYYLLNVQLQVEPRLSQELLVQGPDRESQLVRFLDELLFLGEQAGIAFDRFKIEVDGEIVSAFLEGAKILSQSKEVKAVTYHYLQIVEGKDGLSTTIVFDV